MPRLNASGTQFGATNYDPNCVFCQKGLGHILHQTSNFQSATWVKSGRIGSPKVEPKPEPKMDGQRHNINCKSILSSQQYDSSCLRCSKIKIVVFLRRKTLKNGAEFDEELAAHDKAESLIMTYNLTRGEIFDRTYTPPAVIQQRRRAAKKPNIDDVESFG